MNSVRNKMIIKLGYSSDEIFTCMGRDCISLNLVTKKINEQLEESEKAEAKARLYRSCYAKKFNTATVGGIRCIDIAKPMNNTSSALVIEFFKQ